MGGVGEAEEPLLGGAELALVEVAGAAQRGEGGQLVDQPAGGCWQRRTPTRVPTPTPRQHQKGAQQAAAQHHLAAARGWRAEVATVTGWRSYDVQSHSGGGCT